MALSGINTQPRGNLWPAELLKKTLYRKCHCQLLSCRAAGSIQFLQRLCIQKTVAACRCNQAPFSAEQLQIVHHCTSCAADTGQKLLLWPPYRRNLHRTSPCIVCYTPPVHPSHFTVVLPGHINEVSPTLTNHQNTYRHCVVTTTTAEAHHQCGLMSESWHSLPAPGSGCVEGVHSHKSPTGTARRCVRASLQQTSSPHTSTAPSNTQLEWQQPR